ncbi:PadR family transcriptional regulator [Streptacidiphilus anmyonensis]|uniref:PadR family transcriptional regulator n=1 Tax=Streptacidiphilus anmyonensis TaxID=405782 RepID=UPI0005A85CAC|nr:PadR family transcriptional regulator [Streptacidiphilus anmyonensis]
MSLRHALLGLLAEKPASGYDLLKRFETSLSMVWPAQQSQVYGELAKLKEAGLIEVTGTGARNRRDYGITEEGRAELHRWLTEVGPDLAFRSAALLRVFFLWTLSREEGVAYLRDFARENSARQAALEQVRDTATWVGDPVQVCGWLALEFGIRGSQNTADWAEWAAAQLDEQLGGNPGEEPSAADPT